MFLIIKRAACCCFWDLHQLYQSPPVLLELYYPSFTTLIRKILNRLIGYGGRTETALLYIDTIRTAERMGLSCRSIKIGIENQLINKILLFRFFRYPIIQPRNIILLFPEIFCIYNFTTCSSNFAGRTTEEIHLIAQNFPFPITLASIFNFLNPNPTSQE